MFLTLNVKFECQILLAATCSLRQSEIYALTPADICGNVILIHGARVPDQNNKIVYKSTPKSKAGYRKVIAPEYLTERLQRLCQNKNSTDWIFDTTPSGVLKSFKRLLVQNDMYPYTVHSLRHYFAAMLHAKNVPDKYVLEMGGWSTDGVLRKVYQYTFEDETKKVKEEINQYFDTLLK